MPQQRIVLIIEKSPQQRIKLPPMKKSDAQKGKQALDAAKGGKIIDVILEDVPG